MYCVNIHLGAQHTASFEGSLHYQKIQDMCENRPRKILWKQNWPNKNNLWNKQS